MAVILTWVYITIFSDLVSVTLSPSLRHQWYQLQPPACSSMFMWNYTWLIGDNNLVVADAYISCWISVWFVPEVISKHFWRQEHGNNKSCKCLQRDNFYFYNTWLSMTLGCNYLLYSEIWIIPALNIISGQWPGSCSWTRDGDTPGRVHVLVSTVPHCLRIHCHSLNICTLDPRLVLPRTVLCSAYLSALVYDFMSQHSSQSQIYQHYLH